MELNTIAGANKKKIMKKKRKKKKRAMTNERKIFLKQQHLQREIKMTARNTINHRHKWRDMMMKVQMPQLKQDVNIAKNTFDRAIDIRDYCAQLTMECLEKSEVQRHRNVAKHIEAIDKFISIYQSRLDAVNIVYRNNLKSRINDFAIDIEKIELTHNEDETVLRTVIHEGKRRIESFLDNVKNQTALKLENVRNSEENSTKIDILRLEEKLSSKLKYLHKIISTYLNGTHNRRLMYEDLKAKDILDHKIITHQLLRTAELFKSIHEYKIKIVKLNKEMNEVTLFIASGKYQFHEANQSSIEQFNNEKKIDKTQLNTLTAYYNLAIKHLQRLVKRTRAMLFLIRRCRKFQIQSDKILPVRLDHVNDQSCNLDILWYRIGLVRVSINDLRRDREILHRERDRLHKCLKCRMVE